MSDIDDVTSAADRLNARIGLHETVASRLAGATVAQLLEMARGGIGEPDSA